MDSNVSSPDSIQNTQDNLGFAQFEPYVNLVSSGAAIPPNFQYQQPQYQQFQNPHFQNPQYQTPNSKTPNSKTHNSNQISFNKVNSKVLNSKVLNSKVHNSNNTEAGGSRAKKKSKGKGKAKEKEVIDSDGPLTWTTVEEVALCKAWCASSKDPEDGNSKKTKGLWDAVSKTFHELMGHPTYRNHDKLSGKWRQLVTNLTKFNGIYNKLMSEKRSGMSDFDVMAAARLEYKGNGRNGFEQEKQWLVVTTRYFWKLGVSQGFLCLKSLVAKLCQVIKVQWSLEDMSIGIVVSHD